MAHVNVRAEKRVRRHTRLRKKIFGTADCPRFSVYKSRKHVHAQLVDDAQGHTLVYVTTLHKEIKDKGCNIAAAKAVGKVMAKKASEKGIGKVVFDRGGYPYHGVVKALAESAREGGLKF